MINSDQEWLRTNTTIEALKCLEKLDETLGFVEQDPYQWKWAIIVLHNCVQAFMVLTLQGTAPHDVAQNRKKYIDYYEKGIRGEKAHTQAMKLDNFLALYGKIKDTDDTQLFCSNVKFHSTEDHDAAMVRINDFRNQFIHFFPCGWSLSIVGMPETFELIMKIIKFVIKDIGNFMYRFNKDERRKMQEYITSIDAKLKGLEYEI